MIAIAVLLVSIASQSAAELAKQGSDLLLQGQVVPAERVLRRAVELAPDRGDFRMLHGVALLQAGRADLAADALGQAARGLPKSAEAHYNLGIALATLDRFAEAEASFAAAIALHDEPPVDYLFNLGHCRISGGKLASARAPLERALRLDPRHAETHYLLGTLALEAGRGASSRELARKHLQTAREINPRHGRAAARLGLLAMEERDFEAAILLFREALLTVPEDPLARYNLGRALVRAGQREAGVRELEKFRETEGLQRDVERLQRLRRTSPADAAVCLRLAELLEGRGKLTEAAVELGRFVDLEPGVPAVWLALARLSWKTGNAEGTQSILKAAIEQNPKAPELRAELARVQAQRQ